MDAITPFCLFGKPRMENTYKIYVAGLATALTIMVGLFFSTYSHNISRNDQLYDKVIDKLEIVAKASSSNAGRVELIGYDTQGMKADISRIAGKMDKIEIRQENSEARQKSMEIQLNQTTHMVDGLDKSFSEYWPAHTAYKAPKR